MQTASFRKERVGEEIRRALSETLVYDLNPKPPAFVTVSSVKVSPNLAEALVHFSLYGDEDACKQTRELLKTQNKFLRYEVGQKLRLRRVPHLYFVLDDTPTKAARIHKLLDQAA